MLVWGTRGITNDLRDAFVKHCWVRNYGKGPLILEVRISTVHFMQITKQSLKDCISNRI